MKKAAVVFLLVVSLGIPVPALGGSTCSESWKPLPEAKGPVAYTFAPAAVVRSGDRVQVRVRAVDTSSAGRERAATILYHIDCRQGTFQLVEEVEVNAGTPSVCGALPDEIPILPGKLPHLEVLRTKVCPPVPPPRASLGTRRDGAMNRDVR